jgi:hypothetical protein
VQRLNDSLCLPAIAHGLAYRTDDPLERCLTDELPRPYLSAQFLTGDDPIPVL